MRDGEYKIKLKDENGIEEEITLRATPHALRAILTKYTGVRNILQKLYMVEEEAMYDLLLAAISGPGNELASRNPGWRNILRDNIFHTGLFDLVAPLTEYVTLLANGGKHPKKEEDEEQKEGKA